MISPEYTSNFPERESVTPAVLRRLCILNRVVGSVFAVLAILLLIDTATSSSGYAPVIGSWWTRKEGGGFENHVVYIDHSARFTYLSPAFLALAAVDHLYVGFHGRVQYEAGIKRGINPIRWIEYSISASLMNIMIGLLSGVLDVMLLMSIGVLTATCMSFGFLCELMEHRGSRMVFWLGCIPYAGVWAIIFSAFYNALHLSDSNPPDFVYAIVWVLFIIEGTFGLNQYRETSYIRREVTYILLSPTAKLLLAGITWGGLRSMS